MGKNRRMIKLQYRPPDIRDKSQDGKIKDMPFVPGAAPLCSEHAEAAENCACGIPVEVRTIILRSVLKRD
jgi:hypothetical protein